MFLILDNASPSFLKLMSFDNIIVSHQYKKINILNRVLRKIIASFLSIDCSLFYESYIALELQTFFEEKKKNLLEFADECFVMKSNINILFA